MESDNPQIIKKLTSESLRVVPVDALPYEVHRDHPTTSTLLTAITGLNIATDMKQHIWNVENSTKKYTITMQMS